MLYTLKNTAVRLWLTLLIGGVAVLWILPVFGPHVHVSRTLIPAAALLVAIFIASGWLFNQIGRNNLAALVREAAHWERSGNDHEAEMTFRRAVAVCDSFLLSRGKRRRLAQMLSERLARFYLARTSKDPLTESFVVAYLKDHPEDSDVAEIWLQQAGNHGWLEREDHELAFLIGNAQPDNRKIQELLAHYYLMEERTDFPALQTYRRVLDGGAGMSPRLVAKLSDLFLNAGRADEWALEVYLGAHRMQPHRTALVHGIAACLHWLSETERNRPLLEKGRRLIQSMDAQELAASRRNFAAPMTEAPPLVPAPARRIVAQTADRFAKAGIWLGRSVHNAAAGIWQGLGGGVRLLRRSPRIRKAVQVTMIGGLMIASVVLIVNTLAHLTRPRPQPPVSEPVPPATGKFTIQVAAYLKPEHAQRYVEQLKQEGLEVYWLESRSPKKKWYQVRISRFQDKDAARTFAESLKGKGIIDDYYIANYEHPPAAPAGPR
jgi:hypothetical protein